MARTELTTANFIDLEANPQIVIEDITWTTLTAGSNNGKFFSFNDSEMLLLFNDTGGAATFTIPLTEPTDYSDLGITFNDATIAVDNNDHQISVVSSKYKDGNNYINVDCSVAGKIAVVKRYTIK